MSNLATRILPTIRQAVIDYGNTLKLVQKGSSVYDPITMNVIQGADIETIFKGAVDTVSIKDVQGQIEQGDLEITSVIESVIPTNEDKIDYLGSKYSIVDIQPLHFQDVLMAYQIIARK